MRIKHTPPSFDLSSLPNVGLLVFEEDPTSGPAMHSLFAEVARVQVARMPFPSSVPDPLAAIKLAASSILPSAAPDVIGVACTTLGMAFGAERLSQAVSRPGQDISACDPIHAALAAFRRLEVQRLGIVCPYDVATAERLAAYVEAAGTRVTAIDIMNAPNAAIPHVSARSLATAVRKVVPGADAVFVSCTGLDVLPIASSLGAELQLPVMGSIQVMAWAIAERIGVRLNAMGSQFTVP
ncbi:hypothetical protein [Novosphingobium sp.]|uniref:aspartate racemase/maleate isomerase family protein n=1 Tax=Novosphingobium sp. TaxID=1874826 RepID=UPI00262FC342|nr:hypothetical protein [Novosphingobium sp.]